MNGVRSLLTTAAALKIGSRSWWPAAGIRFSRGLLGPDRTLRDSYSKTLESGKVTGRGSLTCLARERRWGSCLPNSTHRITHAPKACSPALPSEGRGPLAAGRVDGMQPAARQVLIESLGLQEAGPGASGCKVRGAPGVCPRLSLCSGARPAAARAPAGPPGGRCLSNCSRRRGRRGRGSRAGGQPGAAEQR